MSMSFLRRAAVVLAVTVSAAVGGAVAAPPALAISSDYCGYGRAAGEPFCFEGSGYRGWRYHQASSGSAVNICVRAFGSHGAYRVNSCSGGPSTFINAQYCNATPTTNSSVGWFGSGTVTLYGHADSRTCGGFAALSGELPEYVADVFRDPAAGSKAGVSPQSAKLVANSGAVRVFTLAGGAQRCVLAVDADGFSSACTTAVQLQADGGRQLVSEQREDGTHRVFGLFGTGATTARAAGNSEGQAVRLSPSGAGVLVSKEKPTAVAVERAGGSSSTVPLR